MSLTSLFIKLRAPLANHRWSWGSVRLSDGVVFLRVWQDETREQGGRIFVRLTDNKRFRNTPNNLGYRERLKHIQMIKNGCRCYAIVCIAEDPSAVPRKIRKFIDSDLFLGGSVMELEAEGITDYWMELGDRVPLSQVQLLQAA